MLSLSQKKILYQPGLHRFLSVTNPPALRPALLFSTPYKSRLRFEDIKELAEKIDKPPQSMKVDALWNAYAALEKSKVKKVTAPHILTDLVSLVRFAIHRENELIPFPEKVKAKFRIWVAQQEADGKNSAKSGTSG